MHDPWVYSNDSNGPMQSVFAKNYLKLGYIESKFGQRFSPRIWGEDLTSRDLLQYYVDHPPLVPLLVSVSFLLFGVGEASARLVPIVFSALSVVFVYLLAEKGSTSRTRSVWAICLYAFTPMFLFFGQMPNHEAVTQCFVLATVYFYLIWLENGKSQYFVMCGGTLALGSMAGWPVYYLGGLLPVHYWLFAEHHNWKRVLIFPLICFGMFGVFLSHIYWLESGVGIASLVEKFVFRAGGGFSIRKFITTLARYMDYGYTPVLLFLSGIFTVRLISEAIRVNTDRLRSESAFILLVLVGLIHVCLFKQGAIEHPYWIYYLSTPLALAGAGIIDSIWISQRPEFQRFGVKMCAVSILLAAFFLMTVPRIQLYYSPNRVQAQSIGKLINKFTRPGDLVLTSLDYMGTQLPYYADRDIQYGVPRDKTLDQLINGPGSGCRVFFTRNESDSSSSVAKIPDHTQHIVVDGFMFIKSSGCKQ